MDIIKLLSSIDHGAQSDIAGNRDSIELVMELAKRRNIEVDMGWVIAELAGGVQEIIENKSKRNALFLSLTEEQRKVIKDRFPGEDIFDLKNTKHNSNLLHDIFSINKDKSETPPKISDNSSVYVAKPKYGLFEHQSDALIRCKEVLDSPTPKVMLHMPTGSGKTRTAMHLLARYLNSSTQFLALWLVAGRQLCEQAADEFEEAWAYLGERGVPVIKLWDGKIGASEDYNNNIYLRSNALPSEHFDSHRWPKDLKDGLIVASVDTLSGLIEMWEPSQRSEYRKSVSLIVFDEAHQAPARTYKSIIETFTVGQSNTNKLIGLSATPGRRLYGDDSSADAELVSLFGNQRVQLEVDGFQSPVDYLIEEGYLSRLDKEQLKIANSGLSEKLIQQINSTLAESMDVSESILNILGHSATRNMQILERVERLVKTEGHTRVIVFAPSVNAAVIMSQISKCIGINSSYVHASSYGRNEIIEQFKSDSLTPMVIYNYGVLATGFDAPRTSAVVIARPTKSLVLLNQMAGRALRGPKVGGNKLAKLITVVDIDIPELVDSNKQFHAFDDSWSNS